MRVNNVARHAQTIKSQRLIADATKDSTPSHTSDTSFG